MQLPLVTIAIPAYKIAFLDSAIESALSQTYSNIEILVVDDQSPYDVKRVVDRYKDNRLVYYRNEKNLGKNDPSINWNECLRLSKGELFCILCDDDVYDSNYVATMVALANQYPECHAFRCGVNMVDDKGEVIALLPVLPKWVDVCEYIYMLFNVYIWQTISEWMVRKSALVEMGGYVNMPMAWGSDWLSIIQLGRVYGIVTSPQRMVSFRNSGLNISSQERKDVLMKLKAHREMCQMATEVVKQTESPYKSITMESIDRFNRSRTKGFYKRISMKELLLLRKEPADSGMTKALFWKGVYHNLLYSLNLKK